MAHYDCLIIGAGMSGLAAAIRLGMYDKKVCLVEKHSVPGGLNSYYQRVKFDGEGKRAGLRFFDVGLHALTNFAHKAEKGKPLTKLLKQLRIPFDEWKLEEQTFSQVYYGKDQKISFANNLSVLTESVREQFPNEIENFLNLVQAIEKEEDLSLEDTSFVSSREFIAKYLSNDDLADMILCPLLIYGSAWEHDMDTRQFFIMFRSLYLEGFSRPQGGVRTIIESLMSRLKKMSVELKFKTEVKKIIQQDQKAMGIELSNGEVIHADKIFSSIGLPETKMLLEEKIEENLIGRLSFVETLMIFKQPMKKEITKPTIIFYNEEKKYQYNRPNALFNPYNSVFCLPHQFHENVQNDETCVRTTFIANFHQWKELTAEQYKKAKDDVLGRSLELVKKLLPEMQGELVFSDVFTPLTIKKFTSHLAGTVYGSPEKIMSGKSHVKNLYVIGTDQGFLGIVGSMLSGISVANQYGLMES